MSKIRGIYVVNAVDEDGYSFGYEVGCAGIQEIKDNSIDIEDIASHRIYEVYTDENKKIVSIENAPVIVKYFEEK